MLTLRLLGTPSVERDGVAVAFDTRKAVAMLALLTVEEHAHSRERLAALLWPEADDSRARSALRRTLSVTAAAVGDALVVDRASVALDAGQVATDVREFSRLVSSSDVGDLSRAAALYRDDFLAGFTLRDSEPFEEWQTFVADGLRQQLAATLERLVELTTAEGDLADALQHARRWAALDPLHEPAHQWLLRLYAWSGQRAAAIRQFRTCVRVLDRELGVAPLQETTALYETIRANQLEAPTPSARGGARPAGGDDTATSGADVTGARGLRLAGRDGERRAIDATVAATGPTGRVVVIAGAPGTGKTSLLDVVSRSVADRGGRTLAVRCHSQESSLAFGVVVELLRSLLSTEPHIAERLPAHTRRELGRLVPELAGGGAPDPLDGPGALARLYAAIAQTLTAAADGVTMCGVLIDDAQWADSSSAGLLAYLTRRLAAMPLLLGLAWHSAGMPPASPLAAAASEACAAGQGLTLDIAGLEPDAVRELLGGGASDEAVDRLHRETGGLPFLVAAYAEDPHVAASADTAPASVRRVLAGRLQSLSETGQQTLAAAAVLGGRIDPSLLRATSGRAESETVDAVEELLRAGLLTEAAGAGGYDLPYDALRQVVLASTTLARRRLLHGRAADAMIRALRRSGVSPAVAGIVAGHLREAGRDDEAATWHWQATEAARALYAHEEALGHVREALALGFPAAQGHLAEGEVLTALGRYRDALTAYERAAASHDVDSLGLAEVEHRLADVHHRIGEYDVADAHLEAALQTLGADTTAGGLRARVLADRALIAFRRHDEAVARTQAETALAAAREADDAAALAQALDVLGVLDAHAGDLAGGERHLRESLDHARRAGDTGGAVAALNNLARLAAEAGDTQSALAWAEEALTLGRVHGDRHRVAALHTNLADLLHAAGRSDEAMDHLKEAAALFAGVDDDTQRRPEIWKLVQW